jgi:transcription elongation factor Elf1
MPYCIVSDDDYEFVRQSVTQTGSCHAPKSWLVGELTISTLYTRMLACGSCGLMFVAAMYQHVDHVDSYRDCPCASVAQHHVCACIETVRAKVLLPQDHV